MFLNKFYFNIYYSSNRFLKILLNAFYRKLMKAICSICILRHAALSFWRFNLFSPNFW